MNSSPSLVLLSLNHKNCKNFSGILLQKKVIITHASILVNYLCSNEVTNKDKLAIAKSLEQFKPITSNKIISNLKFRLTFQNRDKNIYESDNIELYGVFNIKPLKHEFEKIFSKVKSTERPSESDIINETLFNELTSSVVVLIFGKNSKINFSKIFQTVRLPAKPLNKLDRIFTISAPFGFDNFFNTINSGNISNVFGKNQDGFTISTTLPHGCEGSPIYRGSELVGIVVCTGVYFANDNIDFTLAANLSTIINDISDQMEITFRHIISGSIIETNTFYKSTVLIATKTSHGSGCLVKIKNKKVVLTCSHVIHSAQTNGDLICIYNEGKFQPTKILYRNKIYGAPYDLAILEVPDSILSENFTTCANYKPFQHLKIYSCAFPIFSTFNDSFNPSLYEGRVTQYKRGVLFTDIPIQAGQSGGAILDADGQLIGISVQNIKNNNRIYPKLNMAIPICDILSDLETFLENNDIEVFRKSILISGDIADVWLLKEGLKYKL